MKPFRPFVYILMLSYITSSVFIMGCSSETDPVVLDVSEPELVPSPDEPVLPTVTAPVSLSGIWEGTMTQAASIYDVTMFFNMPEGVSEGRVMAVLTNQDTGLLHFLIDAGYQDVSDENLGYDYLVGHDGSQGSFMKYFSFDKNLVGAKRGSITFDLSGNTLTGTATLEDLSDFDIVLNYSLQNARETTMADLAGTWSDTSNGWDDAATGVTLTVDPNDDTIYALATGGSTCEGSGVATDILTYNIYTFDGATINTGVILSNCGTRVTNEGTPQEETDDVDGNYDGMGILIEDDTGNITLNLILSSTLLKTPTMATYNKLIKN